MKNRDIYWKRYMIQETWYIGQWCLCPLQHRHLGTSHSSPNRHHALLYFPESHRWWNLFPFKVDFSLGKSQKSQGTKSGLQGGWVTWVIWCFTKKLCTRCDAWAETLLWWSCQSPVAHSFGLLNHPNSFHGGMFKLHTKLDADSLLYSLSHFECDNHTVHMLTQWHLPPPLTITVRSSLFTHVHSSPLFLAARLHQRLVNHSRYINSGWTSSGQTAYTMYSLCILTI